MSSPRFSLLALTLTLAACAATGDPYRDSVRQQETTGAIVGGILGGVIGHQFGGGRGQTAMTVIGATAGAMIGGRLARDRAISNYEQQAAYVALESTPSGQSVPWQDPDAGTRGSYTPIRTWRTDDGRYCREYQQVVVIAGQEERAYGTACREPDGTWRIVN